MVGHSPQLAGTPSSHRCSAPSTLSSVDTAEVPAFLGGLKAILYFVLRIPSPLLEVLLDGGCFCFSEGLMGG